MASVRRAFDELAAGWDPRRLLPPRPQRTVLMDLISLKSMHYGSGFTAVRLERWDWLFAPLCTINLSRYISRKLSISHATKFWFCEAQNAAQIAG